jgi:predicted peroxiredoxin
MEIKGSSHSNHQNFHIAMVTRNMNMHVDIFLRMHTVGQIPKCNQDIVETTVINIHDRLSS